MKKLILIATFLTFCIGNAQVAKKDWRKQIKAQKVAFITEKLDLSPIEAEKFWPIYNTFEETIRTIGRTDLHNIKSEMRKENLTEKEAQTIINKYLEVEDNIHNLKQKLYKDLKKALPPQKIVKLKSTEEAFNRKLMESYRKRSSPRTKNNHHP